MKSPGKDIADLLSNKEKWSDSPSNSQKLDPNVYLNDQIKIEIKRKHDFFFLANMVSSAVISTLLAPLTTIQVSLQLSVLPHQNKYGDAKPEEMNKLIKLTKEVTLQDRRKYELMIKSGVTGTNRPFAAPVYTSYSEVIKALSNQGILGFFKGNAIGVVHQSINSLLKYNAFDMRNFESWKFLNEMNPILKLGYCFSLFTLIDIITHPLQLMQSRFILQNRLPNFYLYKSIFHFFKKTFSNPRQLFRGANAHFPKNIFLSLRTIPAKNTNNLETFIIWNMIGGSLAYPFSTVIRRLQCQTDAPGMIPLRYGSASHTLKLILTEEGFRGLYRGYLSFSLLTVASSYLILSFGKQANIIYDMKYLY